MSLKARAFYSANVCVLPSDKNDYRPLALRHRSLAAVSAVLISLKVLALTVIAVTPATAELSTITASRITQLTNVERQNVGLGALTANSALTSAAQNKAQHMLDRDYFAHISPSGVTPWFWMAQAGYTYQIAGENLAIDFIQAEDVVAAWLASPSHKDNLLHKSYTETGVAVATGEFQGGTSIVVVHMFGLPTGSSPQTAGETTPTPTPTPTPLPSPTPTPIPSPTPTETPEPTIVPDQTPPRTPRIAITNATNPIQNSLNLSVEGEPGSVVHILINNQEVDQVVIGPSGVVQHSVDVAGAVDGALIVRAFATDGAQNQSADSAQLVATKDTEGPELIREAIAFVISPQTDEPRALLAVASTSDDRITLTNGAETLEHSFSEPVVVTPRANAIKIALRDEAGNSSSAYDVRLAPTFNLEHGRDLTSSPAQLSRDVRLLTAVVILVVLLLLSIAILVHVRVQRPALIAHASFVLLLGLALWVF